MCRFKVKTTFLLYNPLSSLTTHTPRIQYISHIIKTFTFYGKNVPFPLWASIFLTYSFKICQTVAGIRMITSISQVFLKSKCAFFITLQTFALSTWNGRRSWCLNAGGPSTCSPHWSNCCTFCKAAAERQAKSPMPGNNRKIPLTYRVSHSKVWKVILLWWGFTFGFF